jgi:hypothetical protein
MIKIEETAVKKNSYLTISESVAAVMGIAVIVLNTLGALTAQVAILMLSIGMASLAIGSLWKISNDRWSSQG